MTNEGMLVTAAVSLVGAAAFFAVAVRTWPRRDAPSGQRRSICLWYASAGGFLAAAGARLAFGYAGQDGLDRTLFYVAGLCAYAGIVPLAYTATLLLSGRRSVAVASALLLGSLGLAGVAGMVAGGVSGPSVGFWSTEWSMASGLAKTVLLIGILLPAIGAAIALWAVGAHVGGRDGNRLRWVGAGILLFYLMMVSDGLALSQGVLIVERTAMALAALAVVRAYVRYQPEAPKLRVAVG